MDLTKRPDETVSSYTYRICELKVNGLIDMTWPEITDLLNVNTNQKLSPDTYRKRFGRRQSSETLIEIQKERYKLSDERSSNNAILRRISREETLREIAHDAVAQLADKIKLPDVEIIETADNINAAILQLSDWHYGIEIDNYWNKYNPEIAKERLQRLKWKVLELCQRNNVKILYIVNLGDLISGRIHLPLRIDNRKDVITQVIEISELLAQFIADLSGTFRVEYCDCLDNHSRIEPKLKESLDLESLYRIIPWFLKERLRDNKNFNVIYNEFGDDIITLEILGHKIAGVHGHKDKQSEVIDRLSMVTGTIYELVLTAHLHHFSANEQNNTLLVSNGSGMGTDDYAKSLRLSAKPSQNLIIVSKDNVCDCLYKINL